MNIPTESKKTRSKLLGIIVVCSVGLLSSCASTSAETDKKSDRDVTRAQYEAGFREYRACMEGIGYPVQDVREENGVLQFLIPIESQDAGGEECYETKFQDVDIAWQLQDSVVEQSTEAKMLRACLEELGLPAANTQADRIASLKRGGYELSDCMG